MTHQPILHTKILISSLAAVSLLSACGGGGGSDDVTVEPNSRVLSLDGGNIGAVNEEGTKLTAQKNMTSGINVDWGTEGNPTTRKNSAFSVKTTEDGATMTVNGNEIVFTSDDRDTSDDGKVYGFNQQSERDENNNRITANGFLYAWSEDDLDSALAKDNQSNAQVWQYYYQDADSDIGQRGFAVVGTQTDMAKVANEQVASYSGWTRLQVLPDANYDGYDTETAVVGDLQLEVNFTEKTVVGGANNFEVREAGSSEWITVDNAGIAFEKTSYDANGEFSGKLSLNETAEAGIGVTGSDYSGSYSGAFFGKTADQAAGTASFDSEGDPVAYGYFMTDRDADQE